MTGHAALEARKREGMTPPSEERVTQADRDAGAEFWAFLGQHGSAQACRDGTGFRDTAEAFARHRHAAIAPLLEVIEGGERKLLQTRDEMGTIEGRTKGDKLRLLDTRFNVSETLAALTAALAQHRTNGDG